jgi:hypothetical protein
MSILSGPRSKEGFLSSGPVPPAIGRAEAAFQRDLIGLLKTHYRQWVAYHGDERIGLALSQRDLVAECTHRGLKPDEFIVYRIVPEIEDDLEALSSI